MGIITNFAVIIVGSLLGLVIGKRFKENIRNTIMDCIGLFIIISGIKATFNSDREIKILIYFI